MNCLDINKKMSLYIDDLLEDSEKKEFEKHLSECCECKEEYQLIVDNVKLCNSISQVEFPADIKEDFHNKIVTEKRKNWLTRIDWRTYGVVAAAVLIVFVSAYQNMFMENSTQEDMAKEQSSSIGSKWTLANDSDEELQIKMNIADTPKQKDDAQSPVAMIEEESASISDDTSQDFSKEIDLSEGEGIDMFYGRAIASYDIAKSYEGLIYISKDSLEQLKTFLVPYMETYPDINMDLTKEDSFEIKLTMPSRLFTDCLDYVKQFPNVTGYNVDVSNYSEEYDTLNKDIDALNRLAAKMKNDILLSKDEEEKEKIEKELKHIENVSIPEKDNALENIENEFKTSVILIDIQ